MEKCSHNEECKIGEITHKTPVTNSFSDPEIFWQN